MFFVCYRKKTTVSLNGAEYVRRAVPRVFHTKLPASLTRVSNITTNQV